MIDIDKHLVHTLDVLHLRHVIRVCLNCQDWRGALVVTNPDTIDLISLAFSQESVRLLIDDDFAFGVADDDEIFAVGDFHAAHSLAHKAGAAHRRRFIVQHHGAQQCKALEIKKTHVSV